MEFRRDSRFPRQSVEVVLPVAPVVSDAGKEEMNPASAERVPYRGVGGNGKRFQLSGQTDEPHALNGSCDVENSAYGPFNAWIVPRALLGGLDVQFGCVFLALHARRPPVPPAAGLLAVLWRLRGVHRSRLKLVHSVRSEQQQWV
ncbi:hypothetical protein AOLI_G00027320 [Acnodon oligacanthus]